jgi:hypothetical protein
MKALLPLTLLVAAVSLLLFSPSSAEPGCSTQGCKANYSPVCGDNGVTFQNSCLADCQGIRVITQGACTTASGAALASTAASAHASGTGPVVTNAAELGALAQAAATVALSFDQSAADRVITEADMQRYASEDMVLIGTIKKIGIDKFNPRDDIKARPPPSNESAATSALQYKMAGASLTMATADGLVYKPKSIAHAVAATRAAFAKLGSSAVTPPKAANVGGVAAKVVNLPDDRNEITTYDQDPWRRNGLIS